MLGKEFLGNKLDLLVLTIERINLSTIAVTHFEPEPEHCVKSVHIRSYSGPYFRASGLNTERYGVSLHIQSECGKIRTRISPNTGTFYAKEPIKKTPQDYYLEIMCSPDGPILKIASKSCHEKVDLEFVLIGWY